MIWEQVKLGDVATFINGYPFKPSEWSTKGLEIIRIQNLTKSNSTESNYFEGNVPEKYKVKNGDILISWSATLDIFEWEGEDAWLNQHIFKVEFDKLNIDKTFFKYLILHVIDDLRKQVHGATMQHITKGKFENTKVPFPPLTTQKKVGAILDKADALRKKDQQLLKYYDDLAQSLFIEMFGDPARSEFKCDSEQYLLSEISDIVSGVAKNGNDIEDNFVEVPYMRVANVQDSHIVLNEVRMIKVSPKNRDKFLLEKDDILLTEGGDPDKLGRGAIWNGEINPCIHQNHIFRVRVNAKVVNPVYLMNHISSSYGKAYFLKAAKQTTGIASINLTQLKNFQVIVPSFALQNQFAAQIQNIEQQKEKVKAQIQASEELFQALLQQAFSGGLN